MTQSSLAVSADGADWVLLNASPDVRQQIVAAPCLHPRALRDSPIRAVILTNSDVDHIAGLLTLREKAPLRLYATRSVLQTLRANPVFGVLDAGLVSEHPIVLDQAFSPLPGLTVTPWAVPGKLALWMECDNPDTRLMGEQTIALTLQAAGMAAEYVPACADLADATVARLARADLVLFDGTVWGDDDMIATGTGQKTGRRMGHLPMAGPEGSLARLAGLTARKLFIHINNTNPALDPDSAERAALRAAGWELAQDGMELLP